MPAHPSISISEDKDRLIPFTFNVRSGCPIHDHSAFRLPCGRSGESMTRSCWSNMRLLRTGRSEPSAYGKSTVTVHVNPVIPLSRPKGATKGRPQRETLRPAVRTGQWICRFVYGRPTFHDPTGNMSLPERTDRSMLIRAPVSKQGYMRFNTSIPSPDPTGCKRSISARTRA